MSLSPILFIEDNPDDRELTMKAFRFHNVRNPVVVARDGAEAVDYLRREGTFEKRDRNDVPCLILLDLKLPKVSGLEVLREIRSEWQTKLIPVVVFTSSTEESDLIESYNLGANSFVQKPIAFDEFTQVVKTLGRYWLQMNETPVRTNG